MYSPTVAANSNGSVGAGQPFGSSNNSTAHFFQQPQQQQQGGDIGAMDDVQFNASLDALLNGDQLSSITGSSTPQASSSGSNSGSANCNSFSTQQQQQQQAMNVAQPYLVSAGAPGTAGGYAPQQQQALTGQAQPGQQQRQVQHLVGLPLASAHQGALQLVPQGPHSAAQMSLSAAHAAVTGAFHPGNPAPMAAPLPQQQQVVQAPFPWAITSNTVTPTTAVAAAPPAPMSVVASAPTMIDSMQHHQQAASISSSKGGRQRKRTHDVSAVSEDEGDRSKRRNDRNLREQQRSHKITEQIAELREVLSSANLQFKPDKYSTLTKVVEYIRQLQERSQLLDVEHKKLIETISETNEIVNNQYVPAYSSGSDSPSISNDLLADGVSSSLEDESMVYVRGLDYKIAFQGCGIPLALSSIDGRFLDCNDTFLALTGYSREELLPLDEPGQKNTVSFSPNQDESSKKNLSLFNLLSRDDMEQVFTAMSEMLKHPGSIGTPETKPTDASRMADFWSGPVKLCHQDNKPVRLGCKSPFLTSLFV